MLVPKVKSRTAGRLNTGFGLSKLSNCPHNTSIFRVFVPLVVITTAALSVFTLAAGAVFLISKAIMRPSICTVGLAAALLTVSSADAHSRGFAWFLAHSRPHGDCSGQNVVASYYVSGRRTASGQTFRPDGHTAAHRTLPFGSQVTITNPYNGRSVTVVINDRGPFTRGVTLDLARGAARAIGMRGTQWVCLN